LVLGKKLTNPEKHIWLHSTAQILKKGNGICYTRGKKKFKSLYFWEDFVAILRLAGQHFARVRRRTALHWVDNLYYLVAGHSPVREEPTKCLEAAAIVTTSLTGEKVAAELIPEGVVGLPSVVAAKSADESRERAVGVEVGAEGLVAATPVCRHRRHSMAELPPHNLYCPASFLKVHQF